MYDVKNTLFDFGSIIGHISLYLLQDRSAWNSLGTRCVDEAVIPVYKVPQLAYQVDVLVLLRNMSVLSTYSSNT